MRAMEARHCHGMTLIELMVSMTLGLVIIGGATSVVIANRQSYRTSEALSQLQESQRAAFELLSRDVREAGFNGCDSRGRVANVLERNAANLFWWQTWVGMQGQEGNQASGAVSFGTAVGTRVAGTDSIIVQGVQGVGVSVDTHQATSANIKITTPTTELASDDIVILCDFDHAAIFQVTQYNSHNTTVVHTRANGMSPGNCSKGLGYPTICSTNGNEYQFGRNAQIMRFAAMSWYIGNNGRAAEGGRSLYRIRMGSGASMITEEVVAGVSNMQLRYREQGRSDFRDANVVGSWANVNAVRIELTIQSADQRVTTDVSVNSGRLQRAFSSIVTLRNRVP
jgi:type IV pilus assembly protein PilW